MTVSWDARPLTIEEMQTKIMKIMSDALRDIERGYSASAANRLDDLRKWCAFAKTFIPDNEPQMRSLLDRITNTK